MKKFQFSMESVLRYRQQVLDAVRAEHAIALEHVRRQEEKIESLQNKYNEVNAQYRTRKAEGMTIAEAMGFDTSLQVQEHAIQHAQLVLLGLKQEEEQKREAVVQAKKDSASIEKLKEKKLDSYNKAVQKSEEQFIDEFVSTVRVAANS